MDNGVGLFAVEGNSAIDSVKILRRIEDKLKANGFSVETVIFPSSANPSSYFVNNYLKGQYGDEAKVGPYSSSIFYALDRYQTSIQIREHLAAGKIVLTTGYYGATMAKQATLLKTIEERKGYYIWLDNLDFVLLGNPRPDTCFVLDANSELAYKELCSYYPRDFSDIDCVRNNRLINTDQIVSILWDKLNALLPPPNQVKGSAQQPDLNLKPRYHIPDDLDEELRRSYVDDLDKILSNHSELLAELINYLAQNSKSKPDERDNDIQANISFQALATVKAVLPVATNFSEDSELIPALDINPKIQKIVDAKLPGIYGQHEHAVLFSAVNPKNELDLVPEILYGSSHLSIKEIKESVAKWAYSQKADALLSSPAALKQASYDLDLLCSYQTIQDLQPLTDQMEVQNLTPRYGYEVPDLIIAAGLEDLFQDCFDTSLGLHSKLVAAGKELEAQYATLHGHKQRAKLDITADKLAGAYHAFQDNSRVSTDTLKIIGLIRDKQAEFHPLLAESMK